jgi:hypothetical protein
MGAMRGVVPMVSHRRGGAITVQDGAVDMQYATSVEENRTRAPRATTPSNGFLHFENPLVNNYTL